MTIDECKPGQRIRVRQTIDRLADDWHGDVTGTIRKVELAKTGSWYAHSKDGQLWLQRIQLEKDDGEISVLNIDSLAEIELLGDAPGH